MCRKKRKNQLRPLAVKGRLKRRALALSRLTINVFCDESVSQRKDHAAQGGGEQ